VERALQNMAEYCEKHDVEVLVQESAKDVLLLDRLAMSRTLRDVCQGLPGLSINTSSVALFFVLFLVFYI
jgi:hypothetical protein